MSNDYTTVGDLLDGLTGHGIYDLEIVAEITKFGFTYHPANDTLTYEGRAERLFARTVEQTKQALERDPVGGIIDEGADPSTQVIDATSLSRAIHKLLFPGKPVPSDLYHGRGKGYRMDVASIRAAEAAPKASNPLN